MSQYIIVTRHHLTFNNIPIGTSATPIPIQLGGQSKILIPISSICEFGKRENDNYSIIAYRYAPPSSTLAEYYVNESPAEIEALIIGENGIPYNPGEPTFSLREINALREENLKLTEDLKETQDACDKYNGLWSRAILACTDCHNEVFKLKNVLKHSNPANPCCRETYHKTQELVWQRATSYEPKLKNCLFACTEWEVEFDKKIQENKND